MANHNIFNTVFVKRPRRNRFDLSHDRKFSAEFGNLVPVLCMEVIPSDKIIINPNLMIRLAPMLAPVMHRVDAYIHYFFVPNRILWKNWENFITGGEDGMSDPEFPFITINHVDADPDEPNVAHFIGSVADYLGVQFADPTNLSGDTVQKVSALPFAAFNKIYNDFYRDENLIDELDYELVDGYMDNQTWFISNPHFYDYRFPLKRAWRHDYFTSALPFAQKGAPVKIPLGDSANLVFDESKLEDSASSSWVNGIYGEPLGRYPGVSDPPGVGHFDSDELQPEFPQAQVSVQTQEGMPVPGYIDITRHTYVDLTTATANTINDLRRAFRLQEWLEKNARGGSRYVELLHVHFGITPRDSRLQRAEYIGGIKAPVVISEVLQTSSPQEEKDTPQGNMSGHGVLSTSGKTFSKYVEEHGYIIGIMSVMPHSSYMQGLPRHFTKFDRFDYYWQEFAHIGEQPIYNRELMNFENFNSVTYNDEVFGYTPRYTEYRYIPSTVHGDFLETLDFWHWARKFDPQNPPALNQEFIECNPDKRIFAISDLPVGSTSLRDWNTLYCHLFHKVTAIRPIPKFGIPSF